MSKDYWIKLNLSYDNKFPPKIFKVWAFPGFGSNSRTFCVRVWCFVLSIVFGRWNSDVRFGGKE